MKKLSNLLAALVFASLVIFMSCGGGGDDPAPTPEELAAEDLVGTWNVSSSSITYNGNSNSVDGTWDRLVVSFEGDANGGTFSTTGLPSEGGEDNADNEFDAVWPKSGSWSFETNASGQVSGISRVNGSNSEEVSLNRGELNETTLTVSFDVPTQDGSRTSGIAGTWSFSFSAPQ